MSNQVIILAAGKGTRMKSDLYKVLHPVLGKAMICHVVDHVSACQVNRIIVVVAEGAEGVKSALPDYIEYVTQTEQLGTGHAALMAEPLLKDEDGTTLVICGDTPLISQSTIQNLLQTHEGNQADVTVLTSILDQPRGYGRIVHDEDESILKIVEEKDANDGEKQIKEINTGTYCFNNKCLFEALKEITNHNSQKEYYLTDTVEIIKNKGGKTQSYVTPDFLETIGINDRVALAEANKILQRRINEKWMRSGVTIIDPENTYISSDTIIGQDTMILPGTIFNGINSIGDHCTIGPNSMLENVQIGHHVTILQSFIYDSEIGNETKVGPFAHFRNHAIIGDHVRIGNFVEIKNSQFGNNSNAAHLSYIGDATVGHHVNMGCGSITVNYDGKNKHRTIIGNKVFVGCNSNLIAPIEIGDGAYIAAGSTLNMNVPQDALAIAREKQINKEGYAKKFQK